MRNFKRPFNLTYYFRMLNLFVEILETREEIDENQRKINAKNYNSIKPINKLIHWMNKDKERY